MERLTTRNSEGVAVLKTPYRCDRCGEEIYRMADYGNGEPIEELCRLEELKEQGRLLELPCAVGDKVYCIMTSLKGTNPMVFSQDFDYSMIELFGKTVFLTREEAEEALKRMGSVK